MKIKKKIRGELKLQSSVCPMTSIRKFFLHSERYCSNNRYILNDYIVRLGSIGFENRTQWKEMNTKERDEHVPGNRLSCQRNNGFSFTALQPTEGL